MPNQRGPNIVQINLRVSKDLRRRLIAAAEKSGRSLNAEMNARLENSLWEDRAKATDFASYNPAPHADVSPYFIKYIGDI